MRRFVVRAAVVGAWIGLTACTATWRYYAAESSLLKVEGFGVKLTSSAARSALHASGFDITAKPGANLCDVSIELVYDTNGNGTPGDEGDTRRKIAELAGRFEKHREKNIDFSVETKVTKAYLVVKGRPCNDKNAKKDVLATFEIQSDGVVPRGLEPRGPALAVCGGGPQPHFVELRAAGGAVHLTVGDLRAVRSPLGRLYARESTMSGRPSFLGAAVLVDGVLLRWIPGPGVARIELPVFHGRVGRLSVVTVDRSLRVAGSWRFDDLRF